MGDGEGDTRVQREIDVFRAQGVLAELLRVDVHQADRGMARYSAITGTSVYEVARRVVRRDLIIDRELCVES
jgi:hypothetical protein